MTKIDEYFMSLSDTAILTCRPCIEAATDILYKAWRRGSMIYTAGNGGSCTTAQHLALDLSKGCRVIGKAPVRSMCLSDSAELMAWSNDVNYEDAIAFMIRGRWVPGDVFIAISCSGKSPNIIKALLAVETLAGKAILLTGNNTDIRDDLADVVIPVQDNEIRRQEDIHLAVAHCLTWLLKQKIEATP